jgi:hypothetical protein
MLLPSYPFIWPSSVLYFTPMLEDAMESGSSSVSRRMVLDSLLGVIWDTVRFRGMNTAAQELFIGRPCFATSVFHLPFNLKPIVLMQSFGLLPARDMNIEELPIESFSIS